MPRSLIAVNPLGIIHSLPFNISKSELADLVKKGFKVINASQEENKPVDVEQPVEEKKEGVPDLDNPEKEILDDGAWDIEGKEIIEKKKAGKK